MFLPLLSVVICPFIIFFCSHLLGLRREGKNDRKHYWSSHSEDAIDNAERKVLSCVETPYKRFYVDIGSVVGESDRIWTLAMNEQSRKTPLVMLHGMGAGLALWCPNLDALAAIRPVYAIDLLGFARSSRPRFAEDALEVETQWVESLEAWRRELKLEQFVLLGHSLGGYISTAYAIKYPERVRHLILADPWGFNVRSAADNDRFSKLSFWQRALIMGFLSLVTNPLFAVRAAGPAGRWLLGKMRADISRKYLKYLPDAETVIPDYIYQCNSQTPSGETAFYALGEMFITAKHPMSRRMHELHPALPITDIYGGKSWVACSSDVLKEQRPNSKLYSKILKDATHHIYLDNPAEFNSTVLESCELADEYNPDITPVVENGLTENITGRHDQLASSVVKSNQSLKMNGDVADSQVHLGQSQNSISNSDQSHPAILTLSQHENAVAVQ